MSDIIHETTPAEIHEISRNGDTHFLKDQLLQVRIRFDCWGASIYVCDLTDAMKTGKTCRNVKVEFANTAHNDDEGFRGLFEFLAPFGTNFRALLDAQLALAWENNNYGFKQIIDGNRTTTRHDSKSVRVYSPFATLAPLKAAPAKWTVTHALRAIWNGQIERFRCTGRYTDDYAYDAAENFGIRPVENGRAFCKGIIESPSGWRAYGNGAEVSISCHHFDNNAFTLKLT
jgi:hypothetical protein